MSLLKRVATGYAWNHAGRVIEYALLYCISVLIARRLGPSLTGVYAFYLSIGQLFLIASTLGLEIVATSRLPVLLHNASPETRIGIVRGLLLTRLGAGLVVALLIVGVGKPLADFIGFPLALHNYFVVLAIYVAFRGIASLLAAIHTAMLDTKTVAISAVTVRLIELVGIVVLLFSGYGLPAILVLVSCSPFLQILLLGIPLTKIVFGRSARGNLGGMITLGMKFWLNGVVEFLLGRQADVILLGCFLVGTSAIGRYDVALGFANLINFGLTVGLTGVLVVSFSSLIGGDRDKIQRYWELISRVIVVVVVPAFVFSIAFAHPLFTSLYTNQFDESSVLFQVFAIFLLVTRLLGGGTAADYLQATGNTRALLTASTVSGAANLFFAFLLIPAYGPMGAVLATGIAGILVASMHVFYTKKLLAVRLPLGIGFSVLTQSLVAVGATYGLSSIFDTSSPFALLASFLLIFSAIAHIAKPISFEDARTLSQIDPLLGKVLNPFSRYIHRTLTDRQKWAYRWIPYSGKILDVGSSSTPLSDELQRNGSQVFCIDTDRTALESLTRRNTSLPVACASACSLPVQSNSIDSVLLLDVLEHVSDEHVAINEIHRVLKPRGSIILSVPNRGLFRFLDPENLSARFRRNSLDNHPHRHYAYEDLLAFFDGRFRVVRRHYGGLFVYPVSFALNHALNRFFHVRPDRLMKKLGDIDYSVSFGGWSYNIIVLAEKI